MPLLVLWPTHFQVLPLQISGGTITVSLPAACLAESALAAAGCSRAAFCGQRYGLTALLFNQGINSLQSLGFLLWGGAELLQDTINRCGWKEQAVRRGSLPGPLPYYDLHAGPGAGEPNGGCRTDCR